ncbi:hypothetical protein BC830DRAFT_1080871 [Chytriomyces sp. MP71]|nr:hypothetical protein BC830DRAFT_1080871 [Chytriomyces sp. MP71]
MTDDKPATVRLTAKPNVNSLELSSTTNKFLLPAGTIQRVLKSNTPTTASVPRDLTTAAGNGHGGLLTGICVGALAVLLAVGAVIVLTWPRVLCRKRLRLGVAQDRNSGSLDQGHFVTSEEEERLRSWARVPSRHSSDRTYSTDTIESA